MGSTTMTAIRNAVIISILFAIFLFMGGCSTHISALQAAPNEQILYKLDEKKAFELAHEAFTEAAPSYPIEDLNGPVRGFVVYRRFSIDHYTTMARIFRGKGEDSRGISHFGYYLEVSGNGTYLDGPSFDQDVYDGIISKWKGSGEEVKVRQIARAEYIYDRDRWRLSDRPSEREPAGKAVIGQSQENSIRNKLRTLKKLRDEGLINNEEYNIKRAEILKAF
jgi:hypothetical protein